jgi:TolB protein
VVVTIILLVIAGQTSWLDAPLGIGTERAPGSDLATVSTTGTNLTLLTDDATVLRWSPSWFGDGQQLLFTVGTLGMLESQLVVATPTGTVTRPITSARQGAGAYLGVWSPDGSRVAYIADQQADPRTAEVMVSDADGGTPQQLTDNDAWEYGVSWSPDGQQVVYGSDQGGRWQLWIVNVDGSDAHPIPGTEGGNAPDWSPDGRSIAFTADVTGNDNIYVISPAGGTATRLTTGACHSDNARWSPDGTRLTFARLCGDDWNDIWMMQADGSQPRNLTQSSTIEEQVPAWLPDGTQIGFARFPVVRDGIGPTAVVRAAGVGPVLGLMVGGLVWLGDTRRSR